MLTSRSTATMCSFLSLSITELNSVTVETKVKGVSSTERGFCTKKQKLHKILLIKVILLHNLLILVNLEHI